MNRTRVLVVGCVLACAGLTGCDTPSATCRSFALAVDLDRRGQESPVAAAESFAADGGVSDRLPLTGWVEDGTDATGTSVRSGTSTLHVVRGTDGTWQVDAGERC